MNNSEYAVANVAKCGWVQRQTSMLRRWKPCRLVLYRSGWLSVFEDQHSVVALATVNVPYQSFALQNSSDVTTVPPEGKSSLCLFGYRASGKTHYFCADDPDDKEAWILAIKEAQNIEPVRDTCSACFLESSNAHNLLYSCCTSSSRNGW
uniref:PH domain-containing protein n=1 Tax=Trichuris muris TaxID=70415 RepID=A0A5S6QAL1_TRIMR